MNAMTGGLEVDWFTAVPDWKARIVAGKSLIPTLPLVAEKADRALRIFRNLRCPDIEGTPTYGEICDQWVFDLVRAVFGAFDPDTNARIIREFFLLIPKKNGKTSIAAAIIVVAQILNERPQAELLLIAPTQKIAKMAFKQAAGIIRLSFTPGGTPLEALFSIHEHVLEIRYIAGIESLMVIKAADADVITGSKASVILIDETHQFAKNRNAAGILVEVRGGLSHPTNKGFLLQITTQSKEPPQGVFKDELTQARAVRDGLLTASILPVLYELPVEMAVDNGWRDEATWALVNPHLGRSVSADYLRDELVKAGAKGAEALALFASQHLNVEIGLGLHGARWAGADFWLGAGRDDLTLEHIMATSDVCTVGVDGGGQDDLMAIAVIGRHRETRVWQAWVRAWADPIVLVRRKSIAVVLQGFAERGDLVMGDLNVAEAEIVAICLRLFEAGLLPEKAALGLDVFGIASLLDLLGLAGLEGDLLVSVGQGYKLQPAILTLPRKLKDKTLLHGNQPLMAWCVGNCAAIVKGSNTLITKEAAGDAKIDPVMALFNAAMLMFRDPEASGATEVRLRFA